MNKYKKCGSGIKPSTAFYFSGNFFFVSLTPEI